MSQEKSTLTVPSTSQSPTRKSNNEFLADLKKSRSYWKGRLTQFKTFVDSLSGATLSNLKVQELKLRLQSASEYFAKFHSIGSDIESHSSGEDLSKNSDYIEAVESFYFSTMASAKCLIASCETSDNSKTVKCSHSTTESSAPTHVKLPYIKLATFSGNYDEWLEYRNSYVTMIHDRQDLDPIHKFHYLRSSLSGTALQVVSALEFTASNYTHAWELLESRFHNQRLLIHNHIKSLFNVPCIKQESAVQLRKLIDTILRNLRALKTLKEPTESWDTLIIYLVVSKLDSSTEREWENHKGTLDASTQGLKLEQLLTFLRNRADMLEMINAHHSKSQGRPSGNSNDTKNTHQVHSYVSTEDEASNSKPFHRKENNFKRNCTKCNGKHRLYMCVKFLNLPVKDRITFVNDNKLCSNCLRSGHSINECSFGPCMQCKRKHNSLLHLDEQSECSSNANVCVDKVPACATTVTTMHASADCVAGATKSTGSSGLVQVLLSTALIEVADTNNKFHVTRALLDNGSQHSFITEKLVKKLNAPYLQSTVSISGVGHSLTHSNHKCEITMRSRTSKFNTCLSCIVLPQITPCLPSASMTFDYLGIGIPQNIQLADPEFAVSAEIDILIGADKFWELLNENRIRLPSGPYLQNSKLGWLVSGPINTKNLSNQIQCYFTNTLDVQLRKFWELENIPQKVDMVLTQDERKCEDLFTSTTKREQDGRFSVRIPLSESADSLGDSYTLANKRFLAIERKLERLPVLKKMYCEFMREYEALGHMTRVDTYSDPRFFLPHHGVYREGSVTTKLRVVFDGSAKTTSQKSLNDIQLPGPALQNDIFSILLRFRQYRYVACADVEKLFRQVLIQPDLRSLQCIVWREKPTDAIGIYQLNTVTYGTASAPYLSMRCIRQLALECTDENIARIIKEDIFVDDLLTGHDNYDILLDICEKVSKVLKSGCFPLRKWTFNFDPLQNKELLIDDGLTQNKTLGLGWYNDSDQLHFTSKIDTSCDTSCLTKRAMLSIISQVYDPLGILAPAVIISKIMLQKLWLCKIDWDTPVSNDILVTWNQFVKTLSCLNELRVPRQIRGPSDEQLELHIFSDSSQNAYGACAYARSYSQNSEITVRLICAKSKVAPIKTISIPRLELCGALVGARLYKKIIDSLRLTFTKVYFWTDSTIVMGWVRMSPHLMKTFVQNRVTEINELTGDSVWLHVGSKDNPADLLSRGLNLDSLISSELWWSGPNFLKKHDFLDTNKPIEINSNLPDLRNTTLCNVNHTPAVGSELITFERYSSFSRLIRIYAYVIRFIHNLKMMRDRSQTIKTGPLAVQELNDSQIMLVRFAQMHSFSDVHSCLVNKIPVKKCKQSKRILGLSVFLDKNNIIRVGGRISNSPDFDYDKKHPMLLCGKHHLTLLLFRQEHKRLLHGGPLLLLANIRERWWPLGARNLAKKVIHDCVTCNRFKGKTFSPIMGNLPSERLDPGFPFIRSGVDYAGPVYILNRKGRGAQLSKGYISLFVCLVTRAVHIELVTSLTTSDYLLALRRFISRRGKPEVILSDNGTNFVGSKKELTSFFNENSQNITDSLSNDGIKLWFTPPYSPHIGGLMERGVRSCKFHLRRIVGNARLTYEEFSTVLTQIEAVLNSRPISPMSTDPNDLSPLTPAHFLIGRPLLATPCKDLMAKTTTSLTRYHRIEQLRQHFWQRWSKEYVSGLQMRTKWKTNQDDVAMDTLVLIKEDNMPPLKWRLGRIVRVFPGNDGISRVADIRTVTGIIRRSFAKICPLPLEPEDPVAPSATTTSNAALEPESSKAGGMFAA